ncbi:restriction endonuclease subunit S [Flavobacterium succinicans]|uniref:Type-1 restriction enzyme EcoKI specificity protein n=1 Tax=Flavobacterium succinicans TaxID=29536 RepID=A0A199XSM1_9FLAO|nr:restriction endonuclease subunit S [Flavobacterium succinicans]OAZ04246.1 type-1 restriction enzyme EcoKI specificity protein [Flavobacterium succinicans]
MEKVELKNLIEKPISGEWGSEGTTIPVIRTTNFSNEGRLNLKDIVLRNIDSKKVENKKLQKGDIIIEKSGGSPTQPVGRVVYFDLEGTYLCNNFTSILRPKKDKVSPKYLLYQLFTSHLFGFTNNYQNKTTGIINLKLERYVNELEIPLPSLPTQQKIAEILDTADQLRQYNKQLIEKYDALTQSLFLDMFGDPVHNSKKWQEVKFSDVGKLDRGKSKHRPRNAPELLNGPYPLIQTGDIANSGGYINNYKSTYSEFGLKQSKLWTKGTLCITIAANIAKTGILTFDACFPDSVVGFIPNEKTNNIYVQNWMSFLQAMIEEKAPMAAQKNINLAILKDLEFMMPPIELQTQFAERVQMIEAQKQQAQEALAKSEDLFQSLLQRAFNGTLCP